MRFASILKIHHKDTKTRRVHRVATPLDCTPPVRHDKKTHSDFARTLAVTASGNLGRARQRNPASRRQRTERTVDGMDAALAERGRGQAPKPRSGASKTPGLRSATLRKIIQPAVALPSVLSHPAVLVCIAALSTPTAIGTAAAAVAQ
jgi:hypothetical protein